MASVLGPKRLEARPARPYGSAPGHMEHDDIIRVEPLGFPWQTSDPFLFCVHHDDAYPAGNDALGPGRVARRARPRAGLRGQGRLAHVPRQTSCRVSRSTRIAASRPSPSCAAGSIDHSDSLGAAARFGGGDVQWLTAGRGIVHSEMFPLLDRRRPNPLELFQIWLNLPRADKMVAAALHDALERQRSRATSCATTRAARPRSR